MSEQESNKIAKTILSVIFFAIMVGIAYLVNLSIQKNNKIVIQNNINANQEVYQSPYPDYDLVKNLIENDKIDNVDGFYKISLIENDKILKNISLVKTEKTTEQACLDLQIPNIEDETNMLKSYLYIEFSKNTKTTPEDRIYFSTQKVHNNNCRDKNDRGGYLVVDSNILPTEKSNNSVMFYNMNSISFERGEIKKDYNFKQNQIIANNNGKILIRLGGKAENGNIKIHKAFLIYKCENKTECIKKVECKNCDY